MQRRKTIGNSFGFIEPSESRSASWQRPSRWIPPSWSRTSPTTSVLARSPYYIQCFLVSLRKSRHQCSQNAIHLLQ